MGREEDEPMREILACARDGTGLHYRGLPPLFTTSLLGNPCLPLTTV